MGYARVLYVGATPLGEASFGWRVQEALRAQGHAVQVCADPAETSLGSRALEAMLAAFAPTLVLWDVASVAAAPFAEPLAAAPCVAAALVNEGEEGLCEGVPFDAVVRVSARVHEAAASEPLAPGSLAVYTLPAVVDRRYAEAVISDAAVTRSGVVLAAGGDAAAEARLRSEAAAAGATRVESLDAFAAREGCCVAYELRTYVAIAYPRGCEPAPMELAMRQAEGLGVFVEGGERTLAKVLAGVEHAAGPAGYLEDNLLGMLAFLDERAAALGKPAVRAFVEPARVVVAYGWFGAHNYGDDLLLRLVADRLSARYDNAQVMVIGANPQALRCEFGLEACAPHEKGTIRRMMPWARAQVYCGGLLFDQPMAQTAGSTEFALDPWIEPSGQAAVALLAATYGVPSVMLGIGGGPIEHADTRRAVRLISLAGTRFITRDAHTTELLLASGVPAAQIDTRVDLVLGARAYVERRSGELPQVCAERPYFVVSLREWHENPAGFEAKVAAVLSRVVEETGLRAVFLPFDADDVNIHRRVYELMDHREQAVVLEQRPDEPALLACIEASRFAVAMRLHCSVLHHVLGKPAVGLSYNDKIASYYVVVGQMGQLFPLAFDVEAVAERALAAAGALGVEACCACCPEPEVLARLAAVVDEEYEQLFAAIEATGERTLGEREVFYPRSLDRHKMWANELEGRCAWLEQRSAQAERERSEAQEELAALRQRIAELEGSNSYKVGSALMRVPGKLKRALKDR